MVKTLGKMIEASLKYCVCEKHFPKSQTASYKIMENEGLAMWTDRGPGTGGRVELKNYELRLSCQSVEEYIYVYELNPLALCLARSTSPGWAGQRTIQMRGASIGRLAGWLADRLASWLAGRLQAGWLACWLAGWLVGYLLAYDLQLKICGSRSVAQDL